MTKRSVLTLSLLTLLGLFIYLIARFYQLLILRLDKTANYPLTLSLIWILIIIWPALANRNKSGVIFDKKGILENKKQILILAGGILVGLLLFILFGITKYFHIIKYPLIFVLVTPLVEEIIFIGCLFAKFREIINFKTLVIFLTSLL